MTDRLSHICIRNLWQVDSDAGLDKVCLLGCGISTKVNTFHIHYYYYYYYYYTHLTASFPGRKE